MLQIRTKIPSTNKNYRRRLQSSIKNIQHFKKRNLLTFSYVCGSLFCPPGSGLWIRIRIQIQGPHCIRIQSGSGSTERSEAQLNGITLQRLVALTGGSSSPSAHLPVARLGGGGRIPRKELTASATDVCRITLKTPVCCGSGIFYPWSRIRLYSIPDPNFFHPGSTSKNLSSSRKYDLGCSSQVRILIFYQSRIPGSKRHRIPDPGSGSTTLKNTKWFIRI